MLLKHGLKFCARPDAREDYLRCCKVKVSWLTFQKGLNTVAQTCSSLLITPTSLKSIVSRGSSLSNQPLMTEMKEQPSCLNILLLIFQSLSYAGRKVSRNIYIGWFGVSFACLHASFSWAITLLLSNSQPSMNNIYVSIGVFVFFNTCNVSNASYIIIHCFIFKHHKITHSSCKRQQALKRGR